jgi:hypothetical protein
MYFETSRQMRKQLTQLDKWLDAAAEFAKKKNFEPERFLTLRLAPDQFPLARQVQIVCDTAKMATARVTGKEAPSQPDTEKTLGELQARIKSVLAWLDALTAKDFEGAATRTISQPRWEGKTMTGADYFLEHAVPNFYFHLTTAYAILRHNGVDLGKKDFLGALTLHAPK